MRNPIFSFFNPIQEKMYETMNNQDRNILTRHFASELINTELSREEEKTGFPKFEEL